MTTTTTQKRLVDPLVYSAEEWNRLQILRSHAGLIETCCTVPMAPTPSGYLVCLRCDSKLIRVTLEKWRWSVAYALGLNYPKRWKPQTVDAFMRRYERKIEEAREWSDNPNP